VRGSDQLVLVPDRERSGVDPRVVLSGWELGGRWDARVVDHYYPVFGQTFSELTFSLPIRRSPDAGVFKFLLPSLILLACGFVALGMPTSLLQPRLTLSTTSLLGSVVFHLNATSSLPPLGYLTYADSFMLINYVALFACLASNIVLALRPDAAEQGRVRRLFMLAVPAGWLVAQGVIAALELELVMRSV